MTRQARVSEGGAAIFLTAAELRGAGVDLGEGIVRYEIVDGKIRLEPEDH